MSGHGLACVKCRVFMVPKKTGVFVEEGMPLEDKTWGPYKLWMADLAECPSCGFELLVGFGRESLGEHYQANYLEKQKAFQPMVRIDACKGYKP